MVIMTTAYGQYALDGFEMAVIDYLVKPFSLDRFINAAQKALKLKTLEQKPKTSEKSIDEYFYVKCDNKIERVNYADLTYIEAMANYVTLYTTNKKLVVYLTIKGIQEKLPADKFLQVHKSYIINIDKINNIEGSILDLAITKITIGQSFYDDAIKQILRGRFFKR